MFTIINWLGTHGCHSFGGLFVARVFSLAAQPAPPILLRMAFRAPPTQVGRHAANLLKGNLLKSTPAWLPAVTAVPPGPSIIRVRSKDNNTAALSEKEKQLFQNNAQKTAINRHKEKHLRTKPPRPQPIRYPEDKLRREFYRDHPFELARPQNLVENKLALNRTDFSQLLLPGLGPEDITGET